MKTKVSSFLQPFFEITNPTSYIIMIWRIFFPNPQDILSKISKEFKKYVGDQEIHLKQIIHVVNSPWDFWAQKMNGLS